MKLTAMQDLRNDLVETISPSTEALEEINNEEIRLACQDVVKRTLNAIIKRIDEELLETEKQQIIDACIDTTQDCFRSTMNYLGKEIEFTKEDLKNQKIEAEQYYNETFNN